jgi:hypothetical protein
LQRQLDALKIETGASSRRSAHVAEAAQRLEDRDKRRYLWWLQRQLGALKIETVDYAIAAFFLAECLQGHGFVWYKLRSRDENDEGATGIRSKGEE